MESLLPPIKSIEIVKNILKHICISILRNKEGSFGGSETEKLPQGRKQREGPEGSPSGRRKISAGQWRSTEGVLFLEVVEVGRKGETHGKRLSSWGISTKASLSACATYQQGGYLLSSWNPPSPASFSEISLAYSTEILRTGDWWGERGYFLFPLPPCLVTPGEKEVHAFPEQFEVLSICIPIVNSLRQSNSCCLSQPSPYPASYPSKDEPTIDH